MKVIMMVLFSVCLLVGTATADDISWNFGERLTKVEKRLDTIESRLGMNAGQSVAQTAQAAGFVRQVVCENGVCRVVNVPVGSAAAIPPCGCGCMETGSCRCKNCAERTADPNYGRQTAESIYPFNVISGSITGDCSTGNCGSSSTMMMTTDGSMIVPNGVRSGRRHPLRPWKDR